MIETLSILTILTCLLFGYRYLWMKSGVPKMKDKPKPPDREVLFTYYPTNKEKGKIRDIFKEIGLLIEKNK